MTALSSRAVPPIETVPTALTREREHPLAAISTRWWWAAAAVSTAVLALLNIVVSRTATAPRTPWDEVGVLEMARLIAGKGPVAEMSGSGYYPGWSFVMAPIWWFTDDPRVVYQVAIWIVIVIAVATVWPLTLLGRRVGLSTPQAITVAAIALSLPARTVQADYVLSENLLTFLVVWTVVAAFAAWDRPGVISVALLVLATAAAYLTHARALTVVLTTGVWLVLYLRRDVRLALLGLAMLAGAVVLVRAVASQVTGEILLSGFGKSQLMGEALSSTTPGLVGRITLTHAWAQLVGTFGMVALGLVVLVVWVLRELKERLVGPAGFMLGLAASGFAISVMWWSGARFLVEDDSRFDVWVYTRYIDPVALLLVVIALAAVVRRVDLRPVLTATVLAVAVIVPVIVLVAPYAPTFGTMHGPGNSAGVLHWARILPDGVYERPLAPSVTNENRIWIWASLSVLGMLVTVAILRRHPRVLTVILLATFVVSSWIANPSQTRDSPDDMLAAIEQAEAGLGEPTGSEDVDFDLTCVGPALTHAQTLNWIGYWFSPRDVAAVPDRAFDSDLVVSCTDWEHAADLGAVPLAGSEYLAYQVWVLPGPTQDELDAAGLLAGSQP